MTLTTTATASRAGDFRRNRLLQGLAVGYGLFWIVLAVAPFDRKDWALENILTVALVLVLTLTYRKHPLSDLSYLLIAVFMTLHAVGAHYTYAEVPAGFWAKEALGLGRNHYDRLVHFAFGLLLAYPFREVLITWAKVEEPWSSVLTVLTIMAFSDFFEVLESWVAQIVNPDLGMAYLGTQGDVWDAQKDETAALVGVILAVLLIRALPKLFPKKLIPAS